MTTDHAELTREHFSSVPGTITHNFKWREELGVALKFLGNFDEDLGHTIMDIFSSFIRHYLYTAPAPPLLNYTLSHDTFRACWTLWVVHHAFLGEMCP